MSNDLLFSVLPRLGTVKVFTDPRLQPLQKAPTQDAVSEDERDEHADVRHESGAAQYAQHRVQAIRQQQQQQQQQGQQPSPQQAQSTAASVPEDETVIPASNIYHHLDIFV